MNLHNLRISPLDMLACWVSLSAQHPRWGSTFQALAEIRSVLDAPFDTESPNLALPNTKVVRTRAMVELPGSWVGVVVVVMAQ